MACAWLCQIGLVRARLFITKSRKIACKNISLSSSSLINTELTKLSLSDHSLVIHWPKAGWSRFHYAWLRDNCQCSECYHPVTNQRLLNSLSIPVDISPILATILNSTGDGVATALHIQWKDGHKSTYPSEWLLKYSYEHGDGMQASKSHDVVADPVVWGKEISHNVPHVNYDDIMNNDQAFLEWSNKMEKYGFCLIKDTPVESKASENLLKRVGIIRHTFYGGFWLFEAKMKDSPSDTAFTNLAIEPHTDGNYMNEAPGLQMFHTLHFDGTGGETNLIDGYKLAEIIKQEYPEHYQILSSVPLPYHFEDEHHKHLSSYIPFTLDPVTGHVKEVHFNNCDRLPIGQVSLESLQSIKPAGTMRDIYKAIHCFLETVERDECRYQFRLEPGNALIFDNHRVLHARKSFTGRRVLCGGYSNREDWRSKVMMARVGKAFK